MLSPNFRTAFRSPLPLSLHSKAEPGSSASNLLAAEADLVLAVGTRLQDFTTGSWALFKAEGVRIIGAQEAAAREAVEDEIWRAGQEHFMRFHHGEPEAPLGAVGEAAMRRRTMFATASASPSVPAPPRIRSLPSRLPPLPMPLLVRKKLVSADCACAGIVSRPVLRAKTTAVERNRFMVWSFSWAKRGR